jgi:hypothetical protein
MLYQIFPEVVQIEATNYAAEQDTYVGLFVENPLEYHMVEGTKHAIRAAGYMQRGYPIQYFQSSLAKSNYHQHKAALLSIELGE